MRPHGRARVSSRNPQAFAICDRCGFLTNHVRLQWQYDWAGASLINKRLLVCDSCTDVPQQQLRAIVVPADPVPIQNPRVQDYVNAEQNTRTTQGNLIDPVTGIPIIGGDTRSSVVDVSAPDLLMLEDSFGEILLEDGQHALSQEDGSLDVQVLVRVTQQTGEPPGGKNQRPGTDPNAPGDNDPGLPYSNLDVPETGSL